MSSTFEILDEFKAIEALANDVEYNEDTGEIIDNSETIKTLLDELENTKD